MYELIGYILTGITAKNFHHSYPLSDDSGTRGFSIAILCLMMWHHAFSALGFKGLLLDLVNLRV